MKTDSPDPIVVGGTLVYTLAVSNAGLDRVRVTDRWGVTSASARARASELASRCDTVTCTAQPVGGRRGAADHDYRHGSGDHRAR